MVGPGKREAQLMTLTIRPVREEDAGPIVGLLNPIIRAGIYTAMDVELSEAEEIDFIRGFPRQGVFHIALDQPGGVAVGIQDVAPLQAGSRVFGHVGLISTFVALDAQRLGVGRALCQVTFGAARAHGFLKLCANLRADNPLALAFYRSQGFGLIGTAQKHALLRGQYIDELLLELFL